MNIFILFFLSYWTVAHPLVSDNVVDDCGSVLTNGDYEACLNAKEYPDQYCAYCLTGPTGYDEVCITEAESKTLPVETTECFYQLAQSKNHFTNIPDAKRLAQVLAQRNTSKPAKN
jgi:hypothetical protein